MPFKVTVAGKIEGIDPDQYLWSENQRTFQKVKFTVCKGKSCKTWVIPKGYISDGFSIPLGLKWIANGLESEAALLHDFLCERAFKQRSHDLLDYANEVFKDHLTQLGHKSWKVYLMHKGVHLFTHTKLKLVSLLK